MNENIAYFLNLITALIFIVISLSIVIGVDSNIENAISARQDKNYTPSELSLTQKKSDLNIIKSKTKNEMLIANIFLEKSREESEDLIINSFGESINLAVKSNILKTIINKDNTQISLEELYSIIKNKKETKIDFSYDNLELDKIIILEGRD